MKLLVRHDKECTEIRFLDWFIPANSSGCVNFYLLPKELAPFQPTECERLLRDLGNYMIASRDRLMFLDPEFPGDGRDSTVSVPTATLYLYVDVSRLFARLCELRTKHIDTTLDLDRFRSPILAPPPLTITQMVRHPNARGDMAKTIKFFHDQLKADQWVRLLQTISHYLSRAKVFGHRHEFYFDGRVLPEGCGFNGGFILHGNEFGIHT